MSQEKENKDLTFLKSVFSSLGRSQDQTVDEVKNELKDHGVDVDAAMERLQSKVKESSALAKKQGLDDVREKRLRETAEISTLKERYAILNREEILGEIHNLVSGMGAQVALSFRDLDSNETEDLRSMLIDIQLLLNK